MTCRCTCTCKQPKTDVFMEWAVKNGWPEDLRDHRIGVGWISQSEEIVFVASENIALVDPSCRTAIYILARKEAFVYSITLGDLYQLYKSGLKIYDIMKWDFKTGEE